jgi:hypothetical protein
MGGKRVFTAREFGLSRVSDFEVFSMMCYEDERSWTHINPGLCAPPSWKPGGVRQVPTEFGRAPEECSLSRLRPEQLAFFERYLPHVLARFGRE